MIAAFRELLEFLPLGLHPVLFQITPAAFDQFVDHRIDPGNGGLIHVLERHDERARVLVLHVGLQQPHRRGDAGGHRHDDLLRRDRLGERDTVQRAGAAERHEREFPRIDAARHRVGADGQRHVRVDDLDDAERGVLDRQAERLRHLRFDGLVREVGIERQVAAEHLVGVEAAENDLRVGDGRLLAAFAVARRARLGARRARPDVKAARGIDVGDRAATGADRDEIDHRHQNRMPVHVQVRAHS